jgi:hypothetical protein
MYSSREDGFSSYHFDYKQSPLLDQEEIEKRKDYLDPITWASEYLALFKESGNSVFYCFDRNTHVRDTDEYFKEEETVYVSIDFNVNIQATGMFVIRNHEMIYLDEKQGHPDTETLALFLKEKFKGHKIVAFPDPTGRSRKSSAPIGRTDFSILEDNGIECLARKTSPAIKDSVAAVNTKLMTASGNIGMYFHPRCKNLIRSMERTSWMESDNAMIDKKEGIEHFSDGVRYATEYLYPVRNNKTNVHRGFGF